MKNCICINDKDFPDGIPKSKYPKLNEEYTIIEITKLNCQGGIMGVKLEEINLDDCAPYLYFAASRFAPIAPINELMDENIEELVI